MISQVKSNYNYNIAYKYSTKPNFKGLLAKPDTFSSLPKKLALDFKTGYEKFKIQLCLMPIENGIWRDYYAGQKRYYTTDQTIKADEGYTDGIYDCIALLLSNGREAYLSHLCPENYKVQSEAENLQEVLSGYISDLSSENLKPEAWLLGGYSSLSKSFGEMLEFVLEENNVNDVKKILYDGRELGGHSLYYNLKKGQVIIDNGCYKNLKALTNYYHFEEVSNNLKKWFWFF